MRSELRHRKPLAVVSPSASAAPAAVTGVSSGGSVSTTATSYAVATGASGLDAAFDTVIVNVAGLPAATVAGATDLLIVTEGSATPTLAMRSPAVRADGPVDIEARHVARAILAPAVTPLPVPMVAAAVRENTVPSAGTTMLGRPAPATLASIAAASPGKYIRNRPPVESRT